MTKQIKHLRTYWKGLKRGKKFMAGSLMPSVTQRQYIFSDFDRDRTPNIDPFPFNPYVSKPASDTSLAGELLTIEKEAKKFGAPTKKISTILKKIRGVEIKHRIKTPFSVINKLRRKFLPQIKDIGGVAILTKDMSGVKEASEFVEKRFGVIEKDDYYESPKDKYYRAIHYTILFEGKPFEIQIKTKDDWKTAQTRHKSYKRGLI